MLTVNVIWQVGKDRIDRKYIWKAQRAELSDQLDVGNESLEGVKSSFLDAGIDQW